VPRLSLSGPTLRRGEPCHLGSGPWFNPAKPDGATPGYDVARLITREPSTRPFPAKPSPVGRRPNTHRLRPRPLKQILATFVRYCWPKTFKTILLPKPARSVVSGRRIGGRPHGFGRGRELFSSWVSVDGPVASTLSLPTHKLPRSSGRACPGTRGRDGTPSGKSHLFAPEQAGISTGAPKVREGVRGHPAVFWFKSGRPTRESRNSTRPRSLEKGCGLARIIDCHPAAVPASRTVTRVTRRMRI